MALRFRYSLRTLLLVVGLLSIPFAYVAHEAHIVAQRKAWHESHFVWNLLENFDEGRFHEPAAVPTLRRWLGDKPIDRLIVSTTDLPLAKQLFPEAEIGVPDDAPTLPQAPISARN